MARTDPHSYYDDAQPRTRHLGLELEVDFEGRCLHGWAMLDLGEPSSGPLDLDTKGLEVDFLRQQVRAEGGAPLVVDTGVLPRDEVGPRHRRLGRDGRAQGHQLAAFGQDAIEGWHEALRAVLGHEAMLWLATAEALGFRHNRVPMAVLAATVAMARSRSSSCT